MDEVFDYQIARLSDPHTSYPIQQTFKYNIHNVIEEGETLQATPNTVRFDAKTYGSDTFSWAKEVLWFGRRVGRYKTTAEIL